MLCISASGQHLLQQQQQQWSIHVRNAWRLSGGRRGRQPGRQQLGQLLPDRGGPGGSERQEPRKLPGELVRSGRLSPLHAAGGGGARRHRVPLGRGGDGARVLARLRAHGRAGGAPGRGPRGRQ